MKIYQQLLESGEQGAVKLGLMLLKIRRQRDKYGTNTFKIGKVVYNAFDSSDGINAHFYREGKKWMELFNFRLL